MIDYYCSALSAWVKGDSATLAAALHKIGLDTVKTPVARIMAVESAADGHAPKLLAVAFHSLISSPSMFDFHERGRRAVKRFVANHFPDKLPIHELGKLADLAISSGGDDIHEIHPATHCLRSAGWKVDAERLVRMARRGGDVLEVDEALVESVDGRMLVWIWYLSDDASTGSFLQFRRMHPGASLWRTYQISTFLDDGQHAAEEAREHLRRFLDLEDGA